MEASTDVPHYRVLSSLVPLPYHLPILQELVEEASTWSRNVFIHRHRILPHCGVGIGGVKRLFGNVQVSRQDHSLTHGHEVSDAGIKEVEETQSKIVPRLISICRAVDTEEHEGWKLQNNTTTFRVYGASIDCRRGQLCVSRVASDL